MGSGTQLANQLRTFSDVAITDAYLKARVVGAGTRLFRTSKTESESGTADVIYAQDGASFTGSAPIVTDLARPRHDRMRATLWGESEALRGKHGFIYQSSKRPFQESCLTLHDIDRSYVSDTTSFEIAGVTSPVFFVDLNTGIACTPQAFQALSAVEHSHTFGIILESLQQRHTAITVIQTADPTMTFSIESIYRLEGAASQSRYGFAQVRSSRLKTGTSALALLQSQLPDDLFSPYSARREALLRYVFDPQVRGIWDETIFPAFKDLVRYGAD